ncbi:MAG: DUF6036 family nucleotidyltransferase [Steroidobacter sp.]
MASESLPQPLVLALSDLSRWVQAENIPFVIVGGVAASLLGRPRLTRDIDALVDLPESVWATTVSRASAYGFVSRIENPVEFAERSRMLLLRHVATMIDIDVMLAALAFERDTIANSRLVTHAGLQIRLPRVEDLLVMKAIAHRPQDLVDIDGLLSAHPKADVDFVRQWVREFAAAAAMPDLLTDFENIVLRQPTR